MGRDRHNLLSELWPEAAAQEEFIAVLARCFHSSSRAYPGERSVFYPSEPPHELLVEYSRDGEITGVYALPALQPAKLDSIAQEIRRQLAPTTGVGTGSEVFFSALPVQGSWSYRDRFRVFPVPPNAPRPPAGMLGAEHPFLIEYTYGLTANGLLNGMRRSREIRRLRLLLNALLTPWVRCISHHGLGASSFRWTLVPGKAYGTPAL